MKKKQMWMLFLAAFLVLTPVVSAEETDAESIQDETYEEMEPEDNTYFMEPEGSYQMDMDGDGVLELIRYDSVLEESEEQGFRGILNLYRDGELWFTVEGRYTTYMWTVCHCPMPDGKHYLLAASRGDNDWTDQVLLLGMEEKELIVLGDLCEISRQDEEHMDNFLKGWARASWTAVKFIEENTITVNWSDTANAAGMLSISIPYQVTEEGITPKDPPYVLEETEKNWTAVCEITAYEEPGSSKEAFQINPDDVVKLTAITSVEGVYYLQCENQSGETGWIRDADETEYHEDTETYGYFKEAMFAG